MTLQGIPLPEPVATAPVAPLAKSLQATARRTGAGEPLRVPIEQVVENPANPRTEFPPAELDALAQDIALRGVLQPIVVAPADAAGRYRIRMGAMRWRAARQAGLAEVPVSIEARELDVYALLAENLKRCNLSPLNLARVFQDLLDKGETNADISRHLGIDATTVAHHLALLNLPAPLHDAMVAGQVTAPRTLYELNKLHDAHPERVADLLAEGQPITREAVAGLRGQLSSVPKAKPKEASARLTRTRRPIDTGSQWQSLCDRLENAIASVTQKSPTGLPESERSALRQRLLALAERLA